MKIMLVTPTHHYDGNYPTFLSVSDFPTGFAYIAGALKAAGHEVVGVNPNNITGYSSAHMMLVNELRKAFLKDTPDVIGIGGLCTDYNFLKDVLNTIRNLKPGIPVVMGGGIINHDAEYIMNLLKPDYCIIDEAEEAIVKLMDYLYCCKGFKEGYTVSTMDGSAGLKGTVLDLITASDIENIPNLGYWKDGKVTFTKKDYSYGDIDSRPFPDYEPFGIKGMIDDYSMATRLLYRYVNPYPRPFVILTARSCPFNCSFCVHQRGGSYRARSIENIMTELKETYEKYRYNILIILDELFAANNKRMKDFCEGILEGKERYGWDFQWMFQTHSNARLSLETLKMAKEAGCFFFSYGIESASPKVIESMNKKSKVSDIIEGIERARQAGIGFGGNLIFGDPAEDEGTIYESLEFYRDYGAADHIFLATVTPYPGGKIFDDCVKKGLIPDKKLYYENLNRSAFNITQIPNQLWWSWVNFFGVLEKLWLSVKETPSDVERDEEMNPLLKYNKLTMYKVRAVCPYCGESIMYREGWGAKPMFLGVGCPKCNRRIRISLKKPLKKAEGKEMKELVAV